MIFYSKILIVVYFINFFSFFLYIFIYYDITSTEAILNTKRHMHTYTLMSIMKGKIPIQTKVINKCNANVSSKQIDEGVTKLGF